MERRGRTQAHQSAYAPYDAVDDSELGWALGEKGSIANVWQAPRNLAIRPGQYSIARAGSRTLYEIRLAAADLGLNGLTAGRRLGFSLLVNDADGQGREGFIQWSSGIGRTKAPQEFGELLLAAGLDAGSDDGAAPPPDLATARDLAPAPADGGLGPAADLDGSGGLATGGCTRALGSRSAAAPRGLIAALLGLLLLRRRRVRSRSGLLRQRLVEPALGAPLSRVWARAGCSRQPPGARPAPAVGGGSAEHRDTPR